MRVEDHGPVPAERVFAILRQHHLFLFPSLGESFGHVILESLQARCPVLISDRTFFRGLTEERGGWDLPLDRPEAFQAVLRRCVAMDDDEFQRISARAGKLAASVAHDPQAIDQNRQVLQLGVEHRRLAA